jgi:PEP-CTERM motif
MLRCPLRKVFLALTAAAGLASNVASAHTYHFSYTTMDGVSASGTIVTSNTPTGPFDTCPECNNSPGFLATSISGMRNGQTITGLVPVAGFADNDNVVYPTSPNLDFAGLAFASGGSDYNIYFGAWGLTNGPFNTFPPSLDGYAECRVTGVDCIATGSLATQPLVAWSLTAVPEPAQWTLLLIGFAVVGSAGYALRRKELPAPA